MTLINPSQLEPNCSIIMVSGANRSIGAAITTGSHAEGNSLSLAARGPSGVPETANDNCLNCLFDAQDPESSQVCYKETQVGVSRIDGLNKLCINFRPAGQRCT
jgi:NADP-dependent 3-hydroxy acid dehydrogenase YdfG